MAISELQVGSNISFSIYGGIGGKTQFSGEMIGIISPYLVTTIPGNGAIENHTNIWPSLPQEIRDIYTNSHNSYNYLGLLQADGSIVYIGEIWINMVTLITDNPRLATITVSNFTDLDSTKLSRIITANGYTVNTFTIA